MIMFSLTRHPNTAADLVKAQATSLFHMFGLVTGLEVRQTGENFGENNEIIWCALIPLREKSPHCSRPKKT
jgi:hypothetical protein